jgi:hypothetical protein
MIASSSGSISLPASARRRSAPAGVRGQDAGRFTGAPHRDRLHPGDAACNESVDAFLIGQQYLGTAVAQAIGEFIGLPPGVHGHRDGTDRGDRAERQDPLRVVAHRDRHAVAPAHTMVMDQQMPDPERTRAGPGQS